MVSVTSLIPGRFGFMCASPATVKQIQQSEQGAAIRFISSDLHRHYFSLAADFPRRSAKRQSVPMPLCRGSAPPRRRRCPSPIRTPSLHADGRRIAGGRRRRRVAHNASLACGGALAGTTPAARLADAGGNAGALDNCASARNVRVFIFGCSASSRLVQNA